MLVSGFTFREVKAKAADKPIGQKLLFFPILNGITKGKT